MPHPGSATALPLQLPGSAPVVSILIRNKAGSSIRRGGAFTPNAPSWIRHCTTQTIAQPSSTHETIYTLLLLLSSLPVGHWRVCTSELATISYNKSNDQVNFTVYLNYMYSTNTLLFIVRSCLKNNRHSIPKFLVHTLQWAASGL